MPWGFMQFNSNNNININTVLLHDNIVFDDCTEI